MIEVPTLSVFVLYSGFIGLFVRAFVRYVNEVRYRNAKGCKPIARYRQWDPFLGLDLVLSQGKALREHYFIPWLSSMHANMPKTFTINFLGKRQIYTIEPENLKSLTAITWKDFGISPIRRHSKASMPFADKGVNTVDGEDWEFSRFLIKPFFYREVYTSTDRVAPYVDHFLRLLPEDGETFNVQPLLQRWVRIALNSSPDCIWHG
jgi:cytochrome P450 monooxygenase